MPIETSKTSQLKEIAKKARLDALELGLKTHNEHFAPSFSTIEILVALYEKIMEKNDKFILSKGHACLGYYVMLKRKGRCPKCSCHPDIETDQGIDCTTGSLGHGLPIGAGFAFAKKLKKEPGRVFVLVGDGECEEGAIWESLIIANRLKLDNLTIIVDHNKLQAIAALEEVHGGQPNLKEKFEAFGCSTASIDGHNFDDLLKALDSKSVKKGKPTAIIANTVKGKGLSFMENITAWHSRMPDQEQLKKAYEELKC